VCFLSTPYFKEREKGSMQQAKAAAWGMLCTRALPDIMSGPDIRQIFKIRTVRKPDVFSDTGLLTLLEIEEKIQKKKFKKCFF
jgi:hypothetical protein